VPDWDTRARPAGKKRLALVRDLLAIRRREIVTRLANAAFGEAYATGNGLLTANWQMGDGATLRLLANLSDRDVTHANSKIGGTPIWGGELAGSAPQWSVFWRIG
jgi:maltooligosyltrehalose trehalohydrolase